MSTIKANTLLHSDGSTTTQPSIPALDKRMAKAWVNFNGTSTVAIRSSYNISSITDAGTGEYQLNFTSTLADSNYSVIGMGDETGTGAGYATVYMDRSYTQTASAFKVQIINQSHSYVDARYVMAQVFGN